MPPYEYVLPEEQKKDMKEAWKSLQIGKDLLKKLRVAGQPNPEAEVRMRELEERLLRFADAFGVDLTEEE